ncbi:MAG: ion transporter [Oscillospiraceae bacterium]|nr:ion transporter [Oscillospiraceae bacterium]
MRKRIYELIEMSSDNDDILGSIYDVFMIVTIVLSILPLAFKSQTRLFILIDYVSTAIFIIDYMVRWATADYKLSKRRKAAAFLLYPFTPMAIIDMVSILPVITILNSGFRLLRLFRLFRALKVLRVFKFIRHSKNIYIIINVFKEQKKVLGTVATLALAYILISALAIFNVEPESFGNFFDAIYWATISLTTVGYGDIYPVTEVGRLIAMLSSVFGIAIIALPSGVITAGYMKEIEKMD